MSYITRVIIILSCVLFLLVSYGSEGNAQTEAKTSGLPIAFGLPRVVAMNVYMSRGLVVEAVYQATALSGGAYYGRIVNTCTLVLTPVGLQYQHAPTDRLVLKLGTQTHEFVVKNAQGNMTATTSTAWLFSPHRLHYTHRIPGQAEAGISLSFDGSRFQAKVKGWSMVSGVRYKVDLTASGQSVTRRDYHGQEAQTQYNLTGKIKSEGFTVEVAEQHSFGLAAATNLRMPYSMRGSASRFNGTLNNVLRVGEDVYKFDNVQIQTDMKSRAELEVQASPLQQDRSCKMANPLDAASCRQEVSSLRPKAVRSIWTCRLEKNRKKVIRLPARTSQAALKKITLISPEK